VPLVVASPAEAAAPVVSMTPTAHNNPGGVSMVIVTVANVPAGYTPTLSARVGSWPTSCEPFKWRHGRNASVSQKCYVSMPRKVGYWTMTGTATLTKAGRSNRVYRTTDRVRTLGPFTYPVNAATRAQITKCYNTSKNVSLSFDDGYTSPVNLNSILATLKAYNVRAQFFLLGSWARANPAMMRQIKGAGHYVGNHTSTHKILSHASSATAKAEISRGQKPNTALRLIRPPGGAGAYTTRVYFQAKAQGYKVCYWGSDTRDWSGVSAATIVGKVVHGDAVTPPARAGDSVLMHLSNTQSRYALPTMIRSLRTKGLAFDKLR
jgi:peptidoglycan/xylan/chitin deacetylase (PgdA/CDA1 family)